MNDPTQLPLLFKGIAELLTMNGPAGSAEMRLGLIRNAALAVGPDGAVVWLGPESELPETFCSSGWASVDLNGAVVLPGLVDPHTHLVFAGDRAADFAARCAGESYVAIAARGGGIQTTVRATRAAGAEELTRLAEHRLNSLLRNGVTTVEIKSGYGLDVVTELKQLEVIEELRSRTEQRLVATLLCHKIGAEYGEDPDGFRDLVIDDLLPSAVGKADFVDIFVDRGAWDAGRGGEILRAARDMGFGLKAHTEQLTPTGFGTIAAQLGAVSLEHLEYADDTVLDAMAAAGTVAVLLPGASVFLGDSSRPPVAAMRARGVAMALGSDLNPGSSPVTNPWLIATLSCTVYGLSPAEALLGLTRHAARAIGLESVAGSLSTGSRADFIAARVPSWLHLLYGLGHQPVSGTWIAGVKQKHATLDQGFA